MKQIELRPLVVEDNRAIYAIVHRDRAFLGNLVWTKNATIDTITEYIAATNASSDRLWGIFVNGEAAGCITLRDKGSYDEIGYWLGCDHRDRGVTSEAVRLVLQDEPRREVRARILHDNVASRKILRKNGFEVYDHDDMWYYYHLER